MRLKTLLRTSSALPALPLAIGLVALYYVSSTSRQIAFFPYPYAPLLVERPIEPMYPVTYAVVSAAAAWQGARLKDSGVWNAAPYRRIWQVIAAVLAPIIALGWLMFLVPVTMAFIQAPTWPTPASLPPLLLGMTLVVAHALIGFTIGQKIKPLIAAPVLLCLVFIVVAFSHAVEPLWLRHVMGEYTPMLGFPESATALSMLADLLPTAAAGGAAALFWVRGHALIRAALAVALVAVSTFASYSIVRTWGANPPLNITVAKVCQGQAPRICMPEQASGTITAVRDEMVRTYSMLETFGVIDHPPAVINDQLLYGRFTQDPTPSTRFLPLAVAYRDRHLVADVVEDSVRLPCEIPHLEEQRTISFWLSKKLGGNPTFEKVVKSDPYYTRRQHKKVMAEVDGASALPAAQQKSWYRATSKRACEGRP
ncbi:hypothetical protein [Streptomyces sp. 7N604]|uniref:hypothetical protein n=1 Tax=Streptomyces sp. 7N604 TaxID=3457415 RepID=UPI003FD3D98B